MAGVALWLVVVVVAVAVVVVEGIREGEIRRLVAEDRISCFLVFGDSSVDPGNNNRLATSVKSNFPPYGRDFLNGQPTGRFSNGRLVTDFIAEAFGRGRTLTAFLDPNLKKEDLFNGVSFASAGSGYDDLTANLSGVLTISRQLEYLNHYKLHLRTLMASTPKADDHLARAIFVVSLGSNDFLQNYFLEPTRRRELSLGAYLRLLRRSMRRCVGEMRRMGARRVILVGVPNIGCMPISRTLAGDGGRCVGRLNDAAAALNAVLEAELSKLRDELDVKTAFVDVYGAIERAVQNPLKYGFRETAKGCCGTGEYEYGDTCRGLKTCEDPGDHVFWDAVHPSERMYMLLSKEIVASLPYDFFL